MKQMILFTVILIIGLMTFSPNYKINQSEISVVKINKLYLEAKDNKAIDKYGYLVFKQTNQDLKFLSLALAVMKAESDFKNTAMSVKGAVGLMQLMPETALDVSKELGIELQEKDLFNPDINIKLGIRYLKYLEERLEDVENDNRRLILILASYNYGLHGVKHSFNCKGFDCYINRANLSNHDQFNKTLNTLPSETKEYLKNVEMFYGRYKKAFNVI